MSENRTFKALLDFESEGRIFIKDNLYTAFYRNGKYTLVAENGEFNFSLELMDRVAVAWKSSFVEVAE
ncbi:hypothetical protein HCB38_07695 [Listeria sp. FSL L7-0083]|uniref:hypothetical protein n=1 Tax=Listeria farberi TaxID=2713500 RepID=UPI0016238CC2|nr:hypothetical protein [Listeria farberi]MBC2267693.1 hypothetical protein [Listeria farberi]